MFYLQTSSSTRQRHVVSALECLSPPQLLYTSLLRQHSSSKCKMYKQERQGALCLLSLLCAHCSTLFLCPGDWISLLVTGTCGPEGQSSRRNSFLYMNSAATKHTETALGRHHSLVPREQFYIKCGSKDPC